MCQSGSMTEEGQLLRCRMSATDVSNGQGLVGRAGESAAACIRACGESLVSGLAAADSSHVIRLPSVIIKGNPSSLWIRLNIHHVATPLCSPKPGLLSLHSVLDNVSVNVISKLHTAHAVTGTYHTAALIQCKQSRQADDARTSLGFT